MHEFDAFHKHEWKMFKFLNKLNDSTQYLLFLYSHLLLLGFCFYYIYAVYNRIYFPLWIVMNYFAVLHLLIHLIALKWKLNVFKNIHSFVFIFGFAIIGMINLFFLFDY